MTLGSTKVMDGGPIEKTFLQSEESLAQDLFDKNWEKAGELHQLMGTPDVTFLE
jgi:hypothetical protein